MTDLKSQKKKKPSKEAAGEVEIDAVKPEPTRTDRNEEEAKEPTGHDIESLAAENAENDSSPPKSRKRDAEQAELEIDINAPEPASKKALRKAKKAKVQSSTTSLSVDGNSTQPLAAKAESSDNNKRSEYGIWIGNMSFGTTAEDLRKFLTSNAPNVIYPDQITRVNLPQGPAKFGKPQNKGFAYVDFSDEAALQTALKLSESMLGGRRLLIKNAKSYEGRPEQKDDKRAQQQHPPSKRIFVGNLGFSATVENVQEHFAVCGPITHTHVATFEDSGKCKGFAWVEFEQISSAEKAVRGWVEASDDAEDSSSQAQSQKVKTWVNRFQGQKLRMEFAEDKAVRYEKRFGKNAKKRAPEGEKGDEAIVEVKDDKHAPNPVRNTTSKRIKPQGRYSDATVQKLTGAITESKGQRTVFE